MSKYFGGSLMVERRTVNPKVEGSSPSPRAIPLRKIISGGQTGADLAAVQSARIYKMDTGGWIPKDFRNENNSLSLKAARSLGLKQTPGSDYYTRTRWNVRDSDGTLIIGEISGGSLLTQSYCQKMNKPKLMLDYPRPLELLLFYDSGTLISQNLISRMISQWVRENNIKILNVAGNRESKNPGIYDFTYVLIRELIKECRLAVKCPGTID